MLTIAPARQRSDDGRNRTGNPPLDCAPPGIRFVPDNLIGDDPEGVKEGLRDSYRRLLSLEFDGLMCVHGEPIAPGGRQALQQFVER
jgi:hypothetical protein